MIMSTTSTTVLTANRRAAAMELYPWLRQGAKGFAVQTAPLSTTYSDLVVQKVDKEGITVQMCTMWRNVVRFWPWHKLLWNFEDGVMHLVSHDAEQEDDT